MLFDLSADPGTPDVSSPWRFLWWLGRAQRGTLAWGAAWGVTWMVLQATVPLVLGNAVEAVVHHDRGSLARWTAVLAVLGIAQAVAGILRHRRAVANFILAATRQAQVLTRAGARVGQRVSLGVDAGEVASLGATDIEHVAELFDTSARFAGSVVAYVGVTAILLALDPEVGAVVAVGAVGVVLAVGPLLQPIERRQSAERSARARASAQASDIVVGLRVLRGLGGEAVYSSRFRAESQDVRAAAVRTAALQSYLDAGQAVLPQMLVVAVTWIAAHLALGHHLSPGRLVTTYAYAAFLVLPVQTIVEMSSRATAARVGAQRLIAVLDFPDDLPVQVPSGHARVEPPPPPDPGARAGTLHDPTTGLVVTSGVLTAVVTADPEQSADLVERLGRWVDTAAGWEVRLGGVPLPLVDLDVLRRRVLAIGREPVLLAGRLGEAFHLPGASGRVDLATALEAASAAEIVAALPDGLDTEVPERARSLSGGQRQRMVLAQALLADPEVLVLDEPTSAVDAHTEAALATGLARVRGGRTTVVCTTSPLVLAVADRVVLLDGVVVDSGTHRELLGRSAPYRATVSRGLGDAAERR